MKIAAIACNIVLFVFTCIVMATDGPGKGTGYLIFGLLLLAVPVLSSVVLARSSMSLAMKIAAGLFNLLLLGFAGWALVAGYPHPKEEGVVAFTVLVMLTPVISLAALFQGRRIRAERNA